MTRGLRAVGVVASVVAGQLSPGPAPGRMIDVGTHRVHWLCTGHGSPTVVLEAGAGSFSSTWAAVQPQVAAVTRVCSYDRAGMGWSEPAPQRGYSARRVVDDLARALDQAGEKPPFVLVGHSFGGIYVRLFAAEHRSAVAGVVLVDSSHEDQFLLVGRIGSKTLHMIKPREYEDDAAWAALFAPEPGAVAVAPGGPQAPLPPDFDYRDNARKDMAWLHRERQREPQPLGDRPLVVITAGKVEDDDARLSVEQRAELRASRLRLQQDLLKLSRRSRQILAANSGHEVHKDQPALVVDAIRDVVNIVRDRKP